MIEFNRPGFTQTQLYMKEVQAKEKGGAGWQLEAKICRKILEAKPCIISKEMGKATI
jgi:hypothetical protein